MGKVKEFLRFCWPWHNFQGHTGTLKCPKYGLRALSSEPVDGFWRKSQRYIVGSTKRVD